MKSIKKLFLLSIAFIIVSNTFFSCTDNKKAVSAEDVLEEVSEAKQELKEAKKEMKEAIATKQDFFEYKRDSLLSQLNKRQELLQEKLSQLQEILTSQVAVATPEIKQASQKVKAELGKVNDRIEVLRNSTDDNWDYISQAVDSSLVEFDNELNNIENDIKLIQGIKQKN